MKTSTMLYTSFTELCQCTSVSEQQIIELIEQEIIAPESGQSREEWQFSVSAISTVNKAARLRTELMVEWEDVPLVLSLLEEIDQLRGENDRLKHQLNRFLKEESE